jgi:hypothetical protein
MHQNAIVAGSVEENGNGAPATAAKRSHDAALFTFRRLISRAMIPPSQDIRPARAKGQKFACPLRHRIVELL